MEDMLESKKSAPGARWAGSGLPLPFGAGTRLPLPLPASPSPPLPVRARRHWEFPRQSILFQFFLRIDFLK